MLVWETPQYAGLLKVHVPACNYLGWEASKLNSKWTQMNYEMKWTA